MITAVCLNPCIDKMVSIAGFQYGGMNRIITARSDVGGKGVNVAIVAAQLGMESECIGFLRQDNGKIVERKLLTSGTQGDFLWLDGQVRTNIKLLDQATGQVTEINEPGFKIADGDFLRFLERVEFYLDDQNIFVISGSVPPGFPMHNFSELIKTIKKAGCRLIVDEPGDLMREALKYEPDFVKPNIFELAELVGDEPTVDPDKLAPSARKLLDMGAQAVCVSMGPEGALFISKREPEVLYVNSNPKIYDEGAVGTGDAMVGAIANSMDKNLSFVEMAKFTVATGRACARLAGTEMASLKRVYEVYESLLVYTV